MYIHECVSIPSICVCLFIVFVTRRADYNTIFPCNVEAQPAVIGVSRLKVGKASIQGEGPEGILLDIYSEASKIQFNVYFNYSYNNKKLLCSE